MSGKRALSKTKTFKGVAVSPGIEMARVWKVADNTFETYLKPRIIDETEVESEFERFRRSVKLSREQLENLSSIVEKRLGPKEAGIFKSHALILEDPHFTSTVADLLRGEKKNIEYVINEVIKKFTLMFSMLEDNLIRERSADIRDVGQRILKNLLSERQPNPEPAEKIIIVARELIPSITVKVSDNILGFAVEHGEMTSHAAILARSLNIPAIVGLDNIYSETETGDTIILDGNNSLVIVNPSSKTIGEYKRTQVEYSAVKSDLMVSSKLPSVTLDGCDISLLANINKTSDLVLANTYNANGIGLFRTEFLFMGRDRMPTEDEQYKLYRDIVESANGNAVTIRVLDIGADKTLPYFVMPQENNPQLGCRGIRVLLNEAELFKSQLKAILRASVHGNVKILLPMISSVAEIIEARDMIEEAKFELGTRTPFTGKIEVGIMIEVPATVFILDHLKKYSDFFSIGTNDLIQYLLAVDRNNPKIAHFYEPFHPAIMKTLKMILDALKGSGKEVTLCGELAGDTLFTMILLGLGLRNFSMNPGAIPGVRKVIRSISLKECEKAAADVLKSSCVNETKRYIKDNIFPILDHSRIS